MAIQFPIHLLKQNLHLFKYDNHNVQGAVCSSNTECILIIDNNIKITEFHDTHVTVKHYNGLHTRETLKVSSIPPEAIKFTSFQR